MARFRYRDLKEASAAVATRAFPLQLESRPNRKSQLAISPAQEHA